MNKKYFELIIYKKGISVWHNNKRHIIDYPKVTGIDVVVFLKDIKEPVNSNELYGIEPTKFYY